MEHEKLKRDSLFSACALLEEGLFSFTNFKGIPMILDIKTGDVKLLEDLENYDPSFAVDCLLKCKNDIFALELNGRRMMKYNVIDKACTYFEINCGEHGWGNYILFINYGRVIYIFPKYREELIKFNIETEKIQRSTNLYLKKKNDQLGTPEEDRMRFSCGCQMGKIAWFFPLNGDLAVAYDMEFDKWQEYKLSAKLDSCISVAPYKSKLYILNSKGTVYSWDVKDKLLTNCVSIEGKIFEFSKVVVTDKRNFLLPSLGKDIIYIDLDTGQKNKYISYPEEFCYCGLDGWSKYYGYCEDEKHYYFAMRSMNYLLIVNKQDGEIKWIKPKLPNSEEYERVYIKYNNGLYRETECSIKNLFVYAMGNIEHSNRHMAGEDIWKQVKREC